MSINLIGRTEEQNILEDLFNSNQPEFLAVYGRRRVGKTFLIKKFFEKKKAIFFSVTGIQKTSRSKQISRFTSQISDVFYNGSLLKEKNDWFETFDLLNNSIKNHKEKRKKFILFFDELPWMATRRSQLLPALEYFWNQHWSSNARIKLIICGSSASWIIKKIINNKGGLHNRITRKINLSPFNLKEMKIFLDSKNVKLSNKQLINLYMVTGGIPYYLMTIKKGLSAAQLVEKLAFKKNSVLLDEFNNLFSSIFEKSEIYIDTIKIIAGHHYGIKQEQLIEKSKKLTRGGRTSEILTDLEEAGFIISFIPHFHKKRGTYYRIADEYTLFYLKWVEPIKQTLQKNSLEDGYWESEQQSSKWKIWAGYAFESICYKHISQIRKALKINPTAIANSWQYIPRKNSDEAGAQIDLLFDRKDQAITLCEIKYSNQTFTIDKKCAENLVNKKNVFIKKTGTKKQVFVSIIAAEGVKDNLYSQDLISGVATIDDLFES